MPYTHDDLKLIYEPHEDEAHFVLYVNPRDNVAVSALNARISLTQQTPYVREWVDRLEPCEPNALHVALVDPGSAPNLFHNHECESRLCYQTFYDPEFGLPVVKERRTLQESLEIRAYTYAPLGLRQGDVFDTLIIDRECFWIRTSTGILSLLPQKQGRGYSIGYQGGGPNELVRYLRKLIASNGRDTAAGGPYSTFADDGLWTWVSTDDPHRRRELTLHDLVEIQGR